MLLKWAGGKTWLTKNHPYIFHSKDSFNSRALKHPSIEFKRYIDPFLGGGAVFKYLKPDKAILSDINSELISFYQQLQSNPEALYYLVIEHFKIHSEKQYYVTRKNNPKDLDSINVAARFLYLNYTCYNGIYRVNLKNQFNVPIGDKTDFHYSLEDFITHSKTLKNAEIYNQDFRETISQSGRGDLMYIDPPYTNQSNKDTFDKYSAKVFTWNDQVELSQLLALKKKDGVNIIISNINEKEIINLYPESNGWNHKALDRANIMAYRPEGKKYREILISNIE
tara:strand:+ start:5062 stop:5904 length:843 start_codon:yes stop_codon:yes gene_type:complete